MLLVMLLTKDWKSKDRLPFLLAFTLLIALPTLFHVFCSAYLLSNGGAIAIAAVCLLHFTTLVLLMLTRFSDPGIIPKEKPPPDIDDDFRYPLMRNVSVDGVAVRVKWCHTCNFYRPPRASHCSACDGCIDEFDHHCPWLDNCIGLRNYRFFFLLLISTTFLICAVCSTSIVVAARVDSSKRTAYVGSIAIASITGVLLILIGSLFVFHCYLVIIGQTTNELLGSKFAFSRNPFNKGMRHNCMRISCFAYRPTLVNFFPDTRPSSHVHFQLQPSSPAECNGNQDTLLSERRQASASSTTALFDISNIEDGLLPRTTQVGGSQRSSQPSLLFNGSIDYVVPDTPTLAGTPRRSISTEDSSYEVQVITGDVFQPGQNRRVIEQEDSIKSEIV